jgi:hypothetical protein
MTEKPNPKNVCLQILNTFFPDIESSLSSDYCSEKSSEMGCVVLVIIATNFLPFSKIQENMMTSSNLAICVGPCILWSSDPQVVTGAAYASDVSRVTKLLIDEFAAIFGADVPAIFQTTSNRQNQNTREKLSTEKPASRTPPLIKPSDSVKPFILQRECTSFEGSSVNDVT